MQSQIVAVFNFLKYKIYRSWVEPVDLEIERSEEMRAVLKFSPPLIWISFECRWSATRDKWWQLNQNWPIGILRILATERYFSIAKGTPLQQAVFHLLVPFSLYYNRRGQVTFAPGSDKIQKSKLEHLLCRLCVCTPFLSHWL